MKKTVLLILLLVVLAAGIAFGFYEYNRQNPSLTGVSPAVIVGSDSLFAAFGQDESSANKRYLGKVVEVIGSLRAVEADHSGRITVVIGTGNSNIRCALDTVFRATPEGWVNGNAIAVKGLLIGYNRDDTGLIGPDIEMSRCVPGEIERRK